MEKIKYPPLIKHLSERTELYNQMYREYEMNYGAIKHSIISEWSINVIEPVIESANISNPDCLPQVFKAFYTELLQILSNKAGIVHENEYQSAWLLCNKIPKLTAIYPTRLLKAINSAIESIRTFHPEKVLQWISLMDNSIANCTTIEEFLACGRINAWLCGMAYLRNKAESEFLNLKDEIKEAILINPIANGLESTFHNEWAKLDTPRFIGEMGGYIGFGGSFTTPPLVALCNNVLFVADKQISCALFADSFGKVLLPESSVSPLEIIERSKRTGLDPYRSLFSNDTIDYNDVTSFAIKDSTLVLTRASSHYLYVYGRPL